MKERLSSLDGLRGFAAFAVVLSHVDNNLVLQATGPIITGIFRTFSAGPNAVQILFVLTGFLMAYLYPTLENGRQFIQTRYTRIFPTFIFIAFFFWIITIFSSLNSWIEQILLIIVIAVGARFIWKLIKKVDVSGRIGQTIFLGFIVLQIITLLVVIFFLPHLLLKYAAGTLQRQFTILFSNVTLTMPFSAYTPRLSLVFWSLFAEVLFYICYPFLVVPIVYISKKYGWIVGGLFIILSTKILFDIDAAVMYQGGLLVTNLARGSGFIAGVTVGTLYQQQNNIWQYLKKIFQNPIVNIIVLFIFFFIQWGDAYIRNVASQEASNYYFLLSSWIIAGVIIAALIKGSIIQKIFSHKILVFLGIVSYTLYLSHSQTIIWVTTILNVLQQKIPLWLYVCLLLFFVSVVSVGLAWILYKLVDSLYFAFRKKLPKEAILKKKISVVTKPKMSAVVTGFSIYIFVICVVYVGKYSPSLLIDRQRLALANNVIYSHQPLLKGPIQIPFIAKNNNLSIVALGLLYKGNASITAKKSHHALLVFHLFDKKGDMIFTSTSAAYLVEGEPEFEFGFPPIPGSSNKKYTAIIEQVDGNSHDQILLSTDSTNFIIKYLSHKNIYYPFIFIANRIQFVLQTPPALFALLLVPLMLIFLGVEKTSKLALLISKRKAKKNKKSLLHR